MNAKTKNYGSANPLIFSFLGVDVISTGDLFIV